jgi:hypothetical protein
MKKNLLILFIFIVSQATLGQIPTSGLMGYWTFTGNANDSSGNNNHGVVANAQLTADRFGNPNSAYYFNGINSLITVPNSATIDVPDTQSFTLSYWMRTNANTTYACIIAKHIAGYWNGYASTISNIDPGYCTSSGHVTAYVASSAFTDACSDTSLIDTTEKWFHVAIVYNQLSNQILSYIDGVQQSDIGQKTGSSSNTADLLFGGFPIPSSSPYSNYSNHFNGWLDDIRLYNKALSQIELDTLHSYESSNRISSLSKVDKKSQNIIAYPNPASDQLNLEITKNYFSENNLSYSIHSNDGKIVQSNLLLKTDNNYQIDILKLSKGLYSLVINTNGKSERIMFVKE